MNRISWPDGRFLEMDYDKRGRVEAQKAPVGNNGEYESLYSLPPQTTDWSVDQGAFVNPLDGRHTRLITYHRVEDLRSANETFEKFFRRRPSTSTATTCSMSSGASASRRSAS